MEIDIINSKFQVIICLRYGCPGKCIGFWDIIACFKIRSVNFTNVTVVVDMIADDTTMKCATGSGADNVIATLAPTATVSCGVVYEITQADVDAGSVTNTATVTATPTGGASAPSPGSDTITINLSRSGALSATLTGTLDNGVVDPSSSSDIGDRINYRYVLENTGNVTLSGIDVTDLRTSVPADIKCPVGVGANNALASLAPGASVTCGVASALVQADIDAEEVNNTVTARYTAPGSVGVRTASASGRTPLVIARTVANNAPEPPAAQTSLPACVSPVKDANVVIEVLRDAAFSWKPDRVAGATLSTWRVVSGALPQGVRLNAETGELSGEPGVEGVFNFAIEGTSTECAGTPKTGTVSIRFLVSPSGTVAGILWFDMNKNNKRERNEPLLPGATVRLDISGGVVQASSARVLREMRTTVTSATGFYRFDAVPVGVHDLSVVISKANALKGSWEPDGTPDFRVSVKVEDKKEVAVEIAVVGSTRTVGKAVMTPSMRPLPFAPVRCTWPGLDGISGTAGDVDFSTTTTSDGTYVLEQIPAGDFTCRTWDKATGAVSAPATVVVKASFAAISVAKLKVTVLKVRESGPLPTTGQSTGSPLQFALVLIALGAVVAAVPRVRRRHRQGAQD
jgi:hypothetical protein